MISQLQTNVTKLLLTLFFVSTLSACGFQLRGSEPVAAEKQQVALIINTDQAIELIDALNQQLKWQNIAVNGTASQQIEINSVELRKRVVSLRSDADADEYELMLQVSYLIKNQGNPVTAQLQAEQIKTYSYKQDQAAASSEKESELKLEMYQAISRSIIRRYLTAPSS